MRARPASRPPGDPRPCRVLGRFEPGPSPVGALDPASGVPFGEGLAHRRDVRAPVAASRLPTTPHITHRPGRLAAPFSPGGLFQSSWTPRPVQSVVETLDELIHPSGECRLALTSPEQLVGHVETGQEREPERIVDPRLFPGRADASV